MDVTTNSFPVESKLQIQVFINLRHRLDSDSPTGGGGWNCCLVFSISEHPRVAFIPCSSNHGKNGERPLIWRKEKKNRKSHLGQASYVQVEADDEDIPGYPQSGPYCVLEDKDTKKLDKATVRLMDELLN